MDTTAPDTYAAERLRSFPLFSDLGAQDLGVLAAMAQFRRYPKGAFITVQGEAVNQMYLLVSGRVKMSLASPDGKELVLEHLEAPAHFGETALVDAEPLNVDVIAMAEVELFVIDARDLASAIRVQPRLALSLIGTLSRRLKTMVSRLEDMAFHDATHRVMRVVLNVATASYESQGVPFVKGMTHYDIATLAGTSRETASRVISALVKDGVLATKGRTIVVDLIALRDRIGSG